MIAIYVPSCLAMKAQRIAAYANVLLVESVFEVRVLLVGGSVEANMFSFLPGKEQLARGRKWQNCGMCLEAIERGEGESGGCWDGEGGEGEEEYSFVFQWLFKLGLGGVG